MIDLSSGLADRYRDFAGWAAGSSPCFQRWADGVAGDPPVLEWIGTLPVAKQQPNLVFAAARWHGVPAPGPYRGLRQALLGDDGSIRRTVLRRATQTNEVGRLATLVPAFTHLGEDGPLALLEVGASAGLCLYPDRYDYAWAPAGGLGGSGGPTLACAVAGPVPLPTAPLAVAWRGGVDLNPLDVTDDDAMAWLTTLVWPEQDERRRRLADAVAIARQDPPLIRTGDLLDELPPLVAEASRHGRVVVFHSAVIAYLTTEDRRAFTAMMTALVAAGRCRWVSNEGSQVLPEVTATAPAGDDGATTFVLGVDGRAVGRTHQHGATLDWFAA
ncbi:DUF2332 domain-containing protein [Microlunatus capsulatus]|uniref:DUF2332 domain-containing protein n=1 Tax=Microlunatus capsulatus TaxID=99117 RepID=A0ABS4Z508_9ACTN|nr:DUF2332 domain-containing protein [Microlunatus capsulatus]MBP2415333.1 hypothetical protein [Microlunatus capsulatus]